ncbi:30S ribosomal protein THX [Blattabacterium cuenoti]|nr:30S ribosomal protein THX [Blattabacterium cuenoti]
MGKGDQKTRRGKIINKSYGKKRPSPRTIRKKKKMK